MIGGISYTELALLAAALAAAGLATGVLAGLFGVGGGVLIVPVLYEVFRALGVDDSVRTHLCVGTSLAVIIPTSIRSFQGHLKKGAVDMEVLKVWAVPVIIGVIAGTFVAARAPGAALKLVFAAALAVNGAKMLSGQDAWRIAREMPGPTIMRLWGLMIGFLSTLMGIGGGLFGNLLMSMFNRPIHRAVATSSGLGVLISIPAALGYVIDGLPHQSQLPWGSLGFVSLIGFVVVAPMSTLTAPFGATLAHRFSRRRLEVLYGLFQWAMAIRFVWATISP